MSAGHLAARFGQHLEEGGGSAEWRIPVVSSTDNEQKLNVVVRLIEEEKRMEG